MVNGIVEVSGMVDGFDVRVGVDSVSDLGP
jgi:hypothetical protein